MSKPSEVLRCRASTFAWAAWAISTGKIPADRAADVFNALSDSLMRRAADMDGRFEAEINQEINKAVSAALRAADIEAAKQKRGAA